MSVNVSIDERVNAPKKHFGIYLAYAPTVSLRHEGLGRYLAAFLKGAAERDDVRFVVLCPSWSQKELRAFLASEGLSPERYTLCHPQRQPLILRAYEAWLAFKSRPPRTPLRLRVLEGLRSAKQALLRPLEARLVEANSLSGLFPFLFGALVLIGLALALMPLFLLAALCYWLTGTLRRLFLRAIRPLRHFGTRLATLLANPKDDGVVLRLYARMAEAEAKRMSRMIEAMPQVGAWYCPTAFWPAFNDIRGPKLMCVPDLVLAEFPVDYAAVGGDRFMGTFEAVQESIRRGRNFVTYSETIKWGTLVDRYGVRAADIAVIGHAPNDLSRWVSVSGYDNAGAASQKYCEWLLTNAMQKSFNHSYTETFAIGSVKFLFYASQFRPNKNLISLLKAYQYLLRKRLITHKLILTGNPDAWPPIKHFIAEHSLENDVLCLHRLKVQELAACYRLADLAVNPSLSEGGCPFTFSEALSVNTPAVMARIAVTEEVLTDPALQEISFFDPYNWEDIAHRIEWAIGHREELLAVQRRAYLSMAGRSWSDVVNEHIAILERISHVDQDTENGATRTDQNKEYFP